ncbi:Cytosolic carboxypeptidase 6-like [Scleropages formosus]|uniref:Cytosolic carboxypeptidase 6-like n=1 Tax=Scleropages formosus TaxID=113540 RepID=A0A0P7VEB2_SCLFO|nr:Cytosolic carboxypeptidase 6-like [Scleropages formosus]
MQILCSEDMFIMSFHISPMSQLIPLESAPYEKEKNMDQPSTFLVTSNEAGGEDALVGNVNKLLVIPQGYTGAPQKGHLIFDACFESVEWGIWR